MKKLSKEKVDALRTRKGWSQNELGRQAGISSAALAKMLQHGNPTISLLGALASALGVSIEQLLEDEPNEQLSWCG